MDGGNFADGTDSGNVGNIDGGSVDYLMNYYFDAELVTNSH